MGNTLCIYDGDAQTRQIACLVGSVLSMSAYASYTETWDWERYERIVFIMGPRQAMFSHFAVWQPALQHKELAFLWNDFQNIYTERIAAAIEARLDRPLDVTAFVSSENWLDDTICAAQAIQAREKGQGNPDEAVLQAMETSWPAMPVVLHVIALDVAQMSFVWSGFLKAGRSLRQTYLF